MLSPDEKEEHGQEEEKGSQWEKEGETKKEKKKEGGRIKKSSNCLGEEGEGTHLMSVYQIIHDPPCDTTKVHWSND
jgi:hypothetical protein